MLSCIFSDGYCAELRSAIPGVFLRLPIWSSGEEEFALKLSVAVERDDEHHTVFFFVCVSKKILLLPGGSCLRFFFFFGFQLIFWDSVITLSHTYFQLLIAFPFGRCSCSFEVVFGGVGDGERLRESACVHLCVYVLIEVSSFQPCCCCCCSCSCFSSLAMPA